MNSSIVKILVGKKIVEYVSGRGSMFSLSFGDGFSLFVQSDSWMFSSGEQVKCTWHASPMNISSFLKTLLGCQVISACVNFSCLYLVLDSGLYFVVAPIDENPKARWALIVPKQNDYLGARGESSESNQRDSELPLLNSLDNDELLVCNSICPKDLGIALNSILQAKFILKAGANEDRSLFFEFENGLAVYVDSADWLISSLSGILMTVRTYDSKKLRKMLCGTKILRADRIFPGHYALAFENSVTLLLFAVDLTNEAWVISTEEYDVSLGPGNLVERYNHPKSSREGLL